MDYVNFYQKHNLFIINILINKLFIMPGSEFQEYTFCRLNYNAIISLFHLLTTNTLHSRIYPFIRYFFIKEK